MAQAKQAKSADRPKTADKNTKSKPKPASKSSVPAKKAKTEPGAKAGKSGKAGKTGKAGKAGSAARPAAPGQAAAKVKAKAKAKELAREEHLAPKQAKRLIERVAAQVVAADEAAAGAGSAPVDVRLTDLLRLTPGAPVDLAGIDPRTTPGVDSRARAEAQFAALADRVGELQERLFAAAVGGGSSRRVLLLLQGMDTSGKGGTIRHVVGLLDPNGTRLKAFKAPTPEDLEHDFLWRVRPHVPEAGQIAIFDRSHYEDVLVAKVRKLALPMHIGRRYGAINRFERSLVDEGCVVLKCFLHISPEEQRRRLLARLENPDKHWKYDPHDVDDRRLWPAFQDAYRIALERCGTEAAPWHVVPADRKWYRNYAVLRLLIEALEGIDPRYPAGDFDAAVERERVLNAPI